MIPQDFNVNSFSPAFFSKDKSPFVEIENPYKTQALQDAFENSERQQEQDLQHFIKTQMDLESNQILPLTSLIKAEKDLEEEALNERIERSKRIGRMSPADFERFEETARRKFALTGTFDEIIPTVALVSDRPENIDPFAFGSKTSNFDEASFRATSLYGLAGTREAASPQFNELIGMNAQTLKYWALRVRGGAKGEFWEEAKNKSEYLKTQFQEDEKTKQYLDYAIGLNPYFYSIGASTDFAWAGDNPLSILSEAEAPDGWDVKTAIEELKTSAPDIAYSLFTVMGLTEKDFTDNPLINKNPQTFKYAITDALDTYAYAKVVKGYSEQSGTITNTYVQTIWPLIRDSLNSNDTLAELGLIGIGTVATFTGVLAPAGVPAAVVGALSFASKAIKIPVGMVKAANRGRRLIQTGSRLEKAIVNTSRFLGNTYRLAPHNLGEGLLAAAAKKSPTLKRVLFTSDKVREMGWKAPFEQGFTVGLGAGSRRVGKYALRSFVNGATQGAAEDILRQTYAIQSDFQEGFNGSRIVGNMVEEAVGEIFLGGAMNAATTVPKSLIEVLDVKAKINDTFSKYEGFAGKTWQAVEKQWNRLNPDFKFELEKAAMLTLGITKDSPLTPSQQVDVIVRGLDFKRKSNKLAQSAPAIGTIIDKKTTTPLVNGLIEALESETEGGPSEGRVRMELFTVLNAVSGKFVDAQGKSTLNEQQTLGLLVNIIESTALQNGNTGPVVLNKVIDTFISNKLAVDGKPADITMVSDEELDKLGNEFTQLSQQGRALFQKKLLEEGKEVTEEGADPYKNFRLAVSISVGTQQTIAEVIKEQLEEENQDNTVVIINGEASGVLHQTANKGPTAGEIRGRNKTIEEDHRKKTGTTITRENPSAIIPDDHKVSGGVWRGKTKITTSKILESFKTKEDLIIYLSSLGNDDLLELTNKSSVMVLVKVNDSEFVELVLAITTRLRKTDDEAPNTAPLVLFRKDDDVGNGKEFTLEDLENLDIVPGQIKLVRGVDLGDGRQQLTRQSRVNLTQVYWDSTKKEVTPQTEPETTTTVVEQEKPAIEEAQTTINNLSTLSMLVRPGEEIEFAYEGGSTPGRKRRVKVISVIKDEIKALDLKENQEKTYRISKIKGGVTLFAASAPQQETPAKAVTPVVQEKEPEIAETKELGAADEAILEAKPAVAQEENQGEQPIVLTPPKEKESTLSGIKDIDFSTLNDINVGDEPLDPHIQDALNNICGLGD
jgi:hypothetical protein